MDRRLSALLVSLTVIAALCGTPAAAGEVPAPGSRDRCPVCGMFVAPFPDWTAAAVFEDGKVAYFDGPKDLFRFVFDVAKFDAARSREDISSLWVTEYYTTELVPAGEVRFVLGSDVLGPMGRELVPVRGEDTAGTFSRDHAGKKVLGFEDITPAVLDELR